MIEVGLHIDLCIYLSSALLGFTWQRRGPALSDSAWPLWKNQTLASMAFVSLTNTVRPTYFVYLFIYLLFIYYCCLLNNRWGLLWGCPCLRRPRGQSRSIFGRLLPRLRQVFRFRPAHALAWQTFDRLDVRHPCHLDLETRPALGTQLGTLLCGRDGWIPRWWLEWGT